jgi:hypothetical protein
MRLVTLLFLLAITGCARSGLRNGNGNSYQPLADMSTTGDLALADMSTTGDLALADMSTTGDLALAGSNCTSDNQCGHGAYCRGLLDVCDRDCQYVLGVEAGSGACHRSCMDGHCSCVEDADCPGAFASCDATSHRCVVESPPICTAPSCPSGCTEGTLDQYGYVCYCLACEF